MRQVKYGQRQRGFTLIELVVVIGIILLLVGLVMAIGTAVRQNGETQQTETTIELLEAAVQEWQTVAQRQLTWGIDDDPQDAYYDIQGDPDGEGVNGATWDILVLTELLQTIRRPSSVQSIIAQINPDFVHRYQQDDNSVWLSAMETNEVNDRFVGELTVVDAWGLPIYATHPGRLPHELLDNPANTIIDVDDTIRTFNENWYGVAKNRQVCFVSAGPDGDFGHMNPAGNDPDLLAATEDNVFSYEAISPRDYP